MPDKLLHAANTICAPLQCTALYLCTVLNCCTALYFCTDYTITVLYCSALLYTAMYYTVLLNCSMLSLCLINTISLHCFIRLHCSMLHQNFHCSILQCFELQCSILQSTDNEKLNFCSTMILRITALYFDEKHYTANYPTEQGNFT